MENVLLGNDGRLKLCDFGSATTTVIHPDESWTSQKRSFYEEEVVYLRSQFLIVYLFS